MLNNNQHHVKLIEILKEISDHPQLRTSLGFKGGTAAMLFYDLPRFSVDLDFDLLQPDREAEIFTILKTMLPKHGALREARRKRFTLFFLLSYQQGQHTIKVEISRRTTASQFVPKNYLGIPILVMDRADMATNKLAALITRNKPAMRDIFDLWFFLKNKWPINQKLFEQKAGVTWSSGLKTAIDQVQALRQNQVLQGLGELLTPERKDWTREKLAAETVFYLKLLKETTIYSHT